jgi:hypothetical protein
MPMRREVTAVRHQYVAELSRQNAKISKVAFSPVLRALTRQFLFAPRDGRRGYLEFCAEEFMRNERLIGMKTGGLGILGDSNAPDFICSGAHFG